MSERGKYVVAEERIEAVSRVFQGGKTVVPKDVRLSLKLKDGDKIVWILERGKWVIENAEKCLLKR